MDADLIEGFVHCLKELGGINGCDIHETLAGCSKFLDVVAVAIPKRSAVNRRTDDGGGSRVQAEVIYITSLGDRANGLLQRVRFQLSVHSDYMLLAQGLIGNMPSLCREASLVFSDPAVPPNPGDEFGLFVPKILKPGTFNFEYA